MRVLVTGDRNWDDYRSVAAVLSGFLAEDLDHTFTLIEGGARGADALADAWAESYDQVRALVMHEQYPAEWDRYGRAAGPKRNQKMLDLGKPDVVVAFHDNLAESRGTKDMVLRAKRAGIPVYLVSRP